ncbi:hypothetical protein AUEXF2481DRAFT_2756 [Aureobasidium subglaciale EXF-2481]|uniref:RRM domain-containing protein n=1 Tax=Aureobasidium subglaciale (strain EXF-2481) TaxID=1043005 RepID=A0A074YNX5_AURSE|nr:uncharacterized protein AUEXF2481DRAFT_2756 [Aureobasidium subglaciale EXF-2481]KAI5197429.1 hypothetical protein E4T38_07986 [Aureobasidium subglaciale]KAI5216287.1 hypothetical protein E4T40_07996 [Aureobasidium subglaciale]KAI5219558.1 hypothetical protein E4T41_07911 [Aureobasidium subglaciale]KAI5257574.1 hypothetical protein E4T46_07887 [Aureobasidium subglaciale]KEQ97834.1 hypothetical protein AUEXF2481DRAFT_2756 [Aureobasidium subglaciale EXF-2481]
MAPVKILKRPHSAVQCSSCRQRYDSIDSLDQHLETSSTARRICPKTRTPTLIVCVDCERNFSSTQELEKHIQDSFSHNPELSKPTGRCVFVGRLPDNVSEQDVVKTLFKGFVVETTSMRTHCPHTDIFTFISLTTVAESKRAVKELHNKKFLGQRVIVSLQRSKEASEPRPTGHKARSCITSMAPTNTMAPLKPTRMDLGKENIVESPPIGHAAHGRPYYTPAPPPPRSTHSREHTSTSDSAPPVAINQRHRAAPFVSSSPPSSAPGAYASFHPMPPSEFRPINPYLAHHLPTSFLPGGLSPTMQYPSSSVPQQHLRRHRGRRKQFPPSYDGAPDSPHASLPSTSIGSQILGPSYAVEADSRGLVPPGLSVHSSVDPQFCVDKTWPTLVSSDLVPEARAWTSFREDEVEDAYQSLKKHCHNADCLISAGFHINTPVMPPIAEIKAKVKCIYCHNSRHRLDRLIATTGVRNCPAARNDKHRFPGITHLTSRYQGFDNAPRFSSTNSATKRRAIALDCEMAGGRNGDGFVDQLIQLTAIDYLSGEVLISALVRPVLDITQWRTNIHGVSRGVMAKATRDGTALQDMVHAREVLFSLMDQDTILVGHALKHDLTVLKIVHSRCVDSELLAKAAIDRPGQGGTALKKVCESLLGLGVQRLATHSCLEDSFAARETVIYMVSHPEALSKWAKAKQEVFDEETARRAAIKQAKEEAIAKAAEAVREQKEEDAVVPVPLILAMPALVPTPANEVPDELLMYRGPAAGKRRKGGLWTDVRRGDESM